MRRDQQHIDQPSFFEPSIFCEAKREIDRTPARTTDPATSHEGADSIKNKTALMRARMLEAFTRWPFTDNEAADWCVAQFGECSQSSYRKRGGEIREKLTSVDRRKCTSDSGGGMADVWRAKR